MITCPNCNHKFQEVKKSPFPLSDELAIYALELGVDIEHFTDYWTEKSDGGIKERWQMEKVFDVKKRMRYWVSRNKKTLTYSGVSGIGVLYPEGVKIKLEEDIEKLKSKNLLQNKEGEWMGKKYIYKYIG